MDRVRVAGGLFFVDPAREMARVYQITEVKDASDQYDKCALDRATAMARASGEPAGRRLDIAEKNIFEALQSDDPRRRDAASMFTIRNSIKARRRGWLTSAASADVSVNLPAARIVISWEGDEDSPVDSKLIEHDFVDKGRFNCTGSCRGSVPEPVPPCRSRTACATRSIVLPALLSGRCHRGAYVRHRRRRRRWSKTNRRACTGDRVGDAVFRGRHYGRPHCAHSGRSPAAS